MATGKASQDRDLAAVHDLALDAVLEFEPMAVWRWDASSDELEQVYRPRNPLFPDDGDFTMARWLERLLSPPPEEIRRALASVIETGEPMMIETQVLDAAGNLRVLYSSLARDEHVSRRGPGVLGVTRDLSAQRQLERDKSGADLQLKASIDAAPYGVGIVEANFNVRVLNRAGAQLLGSEDPGELIGRDARLSLRPAIVPEYEAHFRRVLAGATESIELKADAGRWLEVTASPLPGQDGRPQAVFSIFRDLSDRRGLAEQVIAATGREQSRIARDLHDGIGQELAGIALTLEGLRARPPEDPALLRQDLADVLAMVRSTMGELRAIAAGLSPVAPERGGLAGASRSMLDRLAGQDSITLDYSIRLKAEPPAEVAGELFRILQEAVANAIHHSGGSRIAVELTGDERRVRLAVTDNGVGWLPDAAQSGGMGLKVMRYRSQLIGASLRLGPATPSGTALSVTWSAVDNRILA
ncbi:MAG: PAS domain-containing sensor histidine kinase [Steroidobacteraceae bacterium]